MHLLAGHRVGAHPLELQPAVVEREIVRVGQEHVDDREAAGREMRGHRAEAGGLCVTIEQQQRVEADEHEREPLAEARRDDVRLDVRSRSAGRRPRRAAHAASEQPSIAGSRSRATTR
ncbi:MAG: hypothetical protein U0869_06935 [Chloroflexota bacterium]